MDYVDKDSVDIDASSTSLADISLLVLTDGNVPHYASAIVTALIIVNEESI